MAIFTVMKDYLILCTCARSQDVPEEQSEYFDREWGSSEKSAAAIQSGEKKRLHEAQTGDSRTVATVVSEF